MTNLENLKRLIELIFGTGNCSFDMTGDDVYNHIIGALNSNHFDRFTLSFKNKLRRLAAVYKDDTANVKQIVDTVNLLAKKDNWDGAYAEISAYDFLNSTSDWPRSKITLNKSISGDNGVAKYLGYTEANFDCYFNDFDIYLDVKILSDKIKAILNGIFDEVKRKLGYDDFIISAEYPLDMPFETVQDKRNDIAKMLIDKVDLSAKPSFIKGEIIEDLDFKLLWGGGVLSTEGTYNPFLHAKNHHQLVFKHAKKFLNEKPSLLLFVIFPWFSESLTDLNESNKIFYRSFARRVFCQYIYDQTKMKSIMRECDSDISIYEVTQKLSGILFLEDTSIKADNPNLANGNLFAYFNPNAHNKVSRGLFRDYLISLGSYIDDFEFDNY